MPKRELFDSFCSVDTNSSVGSPYERRVPERKISDWYEENESDIFKCFRELKDYSAQLGLPILENAEFPKFIDFCIKYSNIKTELDSDSEFSSDSD